MSVDRLSAEYKPWGLSYKRATKAKPSWAKHGMPEFYLEFLNLAFPENTNGIHLDVGCGNGVKTIVMANDGLNTVGIDQSIEGFNGAERSVKELGLEERCRFIQADATVKIPLEDRSVSSATDILMGTHLRNGDLEKYLTELKRVMQPGAPLLVVAFSLADEHFHGYPVSLEYAFDTALIDPKLEPEHDQYLHYQGMYNRHSDRADIQDRLGGHFGIMCAKEVQHPVYSHRRLWNVIMRNESR